MTCNEFTLQVSEFVDEELPLHKTRALFSHLGECDECWEYFQRISSIHKALQGSSQVAGCATIEIRSSGAGGERGKGDPLQEPVWIHQRFTLSPASLLLNSIIAFILGSALTMMVFGSGGRSNLENRAGLEVGYSRALQLTFEQRGIPK